MQVRVIPRPPGSSPRRRGRQEKRVASAVAWDLLHLRKPRTRENLIARSHIRSVARRDLEDLGFLEVDTPALGERVEGGLNRSTL
jgi:aspartyl-tRNA synthetase